MSDKPTLLVIGNCQAQPLSNILSRSGAVTVLPPIIVHLARPDDEQKHCDMITAADIVLAQKTDDNYPLSYLRSSVLHAEHPRALVWPNVFYAGQQPFLRYMTHPQAGRLFGPLEAIHDLRLFSRWLEARGVARTSWPERNSYEAAVKIASLQDLQRREASCDVIISDHILLHQDNGIMFFTFNHPVRSLLEVIASRALAALGLPTATQLPFTVDQREPLDRYITPSTWTGDVTDPLVGGFRGDGYVLEPDGRVTRVPKPPVLYTSEALENAYFEIYDHNPAFHELDKIRLTPSFPFDPVWS